MALSQFEQERDRRIGEFYLRELMQSVAANPRKRNLLYNIASMRHDLTVVSDISLPDKLIQGFSFDRLGWQAPADSLAPPVLYIGKEDLGIRVHLPLKEAMGTIEVARRVHVGQTEYLIDYQPTLIRIGGVYEGHVAALTYEASSRRLVEIATSIANPALDIIHKSGLVFALGGVIGMDILEPTKATRPYCYPGLITQAMIEATGTGGAFHTKAIRVNVRNLGLLPVNEAGDFIRTFSETEFFATREQENLAVGIRSIGSRDPLWSLRFPEMLEVKR